MNTVAERSQLQDGGHPSHGQQWTPEIAHRAVMVNVTSVAESKADSSDGNSDGKQYCWYAPAGELRQVEKLPPRNDVPAYLQIHGQSSNEDPHGRSQSSGDDKGASPGTGVRRVHVVRRDRIVALVRVRSERYGEAESDHQYRDHQTNAQVVTSSLLRR